MCPNTAICGFYKRFMDHFRSCTPNACSTADSWKSCARLYLARTHGLPLPDNFGPEGLVREMDLSMERSEGPVHDASRS